jgi:hypothetical protein
MSRGLCAYAITREHVLDPAGPHGIALVPHGGLALVVAEVELAPFGELRTNPALWAKEPREDDPLVMLARRHDVVVRAVFERHPVLPLRFGTLLRDEDNARRLLAEHHAEARAWLDRVDGHHEWSVRARLTQPGKPPEMTEGLTGDEYLAMRRNRLSALARTRRGGLAAATALHESLATHATEAVLRPRQSAVPLLDAAYLVRTGTEAGFHDEIRRHDELAVEVTGPWPPYSFVRLEIGTEDVVHV